jgi:hypothetical protein
VHSIGWGTQRGLPPGRYLYYVVVANPSFKDVGAMYL